MDYNRTEHLYERLCLGVNTMYISNKVVGLSLIAVAVVAVDFFAADSTTSHQKCIELTSSTSVFVIPNLTPNTSSFSQQMNQATFGSVPQAKIEPLSKAQIERCLAPEQNQVSWLDWVFSDSDSATFHYLDLLELLTPNRNDDNAGSQRPTTQ